MVASIGPSSRTSFGDPSVSASLIGVGLRCVLACSVAGGLVFFVFDLLFLDGELVAQLPLADRKIRLEAFLIGAQERLQYGDHQEGRGTEFHAQACAMGLEGSIIIAF